MADAQNGRGNVRISLSDFGPIAKGDVELRPLTVFVGPSNTGKSYLSTLVYALHKSFQGEFGGDWRVTPESGENNTVLSNKEDAAFAEWLDACKPNPARKPPRLPPLPAAVRDRMAKTVNDMPGFDRTVQDSLERCFGVGDLRALCRGAKTRAKVSVAMTDQATDSRIDVTIGAKVGVRGGSTAGHERRLSVDSNGLSLASVLYTASGSAEPWRRGLFSELARQVTRGIYAPLARESHFFPADRTGIMDAHRVIFNSLVDHASHWGTRKSESAPGLSGTITDFLRKMTNIDDRPADYGREALKMEEGILGGKVVVDRSRVTNSPLFSYLPQGANGSRKMPLLLSSSMVSELAPIVLHLKHVVRRGDLLIIEEPEAHLHPAMQARLAVQLARLTHQGLGVIVTTHSDWLLEQFSNLVGLSMLTESAKRAVKRSYPQLAGGELGVEDVGVWLFSRGKRPESSTVSEVRFDAENTVFPSDFSGISDELYSEWAEITDLIAEKVAK